MSDMQNQCKILLKGA